MMLYNIGLVFLVSDYGDDDGDDGESKLQKQFESYFTTFSTSSLLIMVLGEYQ